MAKVNEAKLPKQTYSVNVGRPKGVGAGRDLPGRVKTTGSPKIRGR